MADVNVNILAQSKEAIQSFKKFQKEASGSLDKVGSGFTRLEKIASVALAGISFKKVIDLASQQENAVRKLNTALALTGEFSKETSKRFQDLASDIQSTSTVGDELSLEMIALAKSMGAPTDAIEDIIRGAVDLSAATGTTLDSAVRNITKTLGGLAGELGESVKGMRDLTVEELKAGKGIKLVRESYQDFAKGLRSTFKGAIDGASNSFGDLLEVFGDFIIKNPVIIGTINLASEAFKRFGEFLSDNRDDVIDFVNNGILLLAKSLPSLIELVKIFANTFFNLERVFKAVNVAVATTLKAMVDLIGDSFDGMISAIQTAGVSILEKIQPIVEGLESIGLASEGTSEDFANYINELSEKSKESAGILAPLRKEFSEYKASAEAGLNATINKQKEVNEFLDSGIAKTKEFADGVKDIIEGTNQIQDPLEALNKKNQQTTGRTFVVPIEISTPELENTRKKINKELENLQKDYESTGEIYGDLFDEYLKQTSSDFSKNTDELFKNIENKKDLDLGFKIKFENLSDQLRENIRRQNAEQKKLNAIFSENVSKFSSSIATSFIEGAAQGAEGARSVVAKAFGGISDLFFPGSGQIVTGLAAVLSQGKEATKQFVKDFADALPEFTVAVAEAAPVFAVELAKATPKIAVALIEAFVDGLKFNLNKVVTGLGPVFSAFFKGLGDFILGFGSVLESFLQDIFGDLFNGLKNIFKNIGKTFANAIVGTVKSSLNALKKLFSLIPEGTIKTVKTFIESVFSSMFDNITNIMAAIAQNILSVGTLIGTILFNTFGKLFIGLKEALGGFFGSVFSLMRGVFADAISGLGSFFGKLFTSIRDFFVNVFVDGFDFIKNGLLKIAESIAGIIMAPFLFIADIFNQFLNWEFPSITFALDGVKTLFNKILEGLMYIPNKLIDLLNSLKLPKVDVGFSVFGKKVNFTLIPDLDLIPGDFPKIPVPQLATGGEIPEGFPNDTFPARLTSGENVVDRSTNDDLKEFLAQNRNGKDMVIKLYVGEKQLADVLLNLNRQGFRVS